MYIRRALRPSINNSQVKVVEVMVHRLKAEPLVLLLHPPTKVGEAPLLSQHQKKAGNIEILKALNMVLT